RNLDEWEKILTEKGDFILSRIQSVSDLPTDPQVLANDYIVDYNHPTLGPVKVIGFPVSFSKTPSSVRLPAPVFGQHTEEILMDVGGYTWEEIEQLKDKEVI
ncbi:MAG: CoA transferase, partial [Dehalococcoidia bacterium]|nr:CoA transferase [Dehalococcoidia bacterium]